MASDSDYDAFFADEDEIGKDDASARGAAGQAGSQGPASSGASGGTGSKRGSSASVSKDASPNGQPGRGGKKRPPSFAMVIVIAIVALVLGFILGYFFAFSQVNAAINNMYAQIESESGIASSSASSESQAAASSSDGLSVNEQAGLPSGHPDLSSMINDDGSINQEALDAYRAQHASSNADVLTDSAE